MLLSSHKKGFTIPKTISDCNIKRKTYWNSETFCLQVSNLALIKMVRRCPAWQLTRSSSIITREDIVGVLFWSKCAVPRQIKLGNGGLCINQFQRCIPPRVTAGHLLTLSVPGMGHLQFYRCPGYSGATPGHLTNVFSFERWSVRAAKWSWKLFPRVETTELHN